MLTGDHSVRDLASTQGFAMRRLQRADGKILNLIASIDHTISFLNESLIAKTDDALATTDNELMHNQYGINLEEQFQSETQKAYDATSLKLREAKNRQAELKHDLQNIKDAYENTKNRINDNNKSYYKTKAKSRRSLKATIKDYYQAMASLETQIANLALQLSDTQMQECQFAQFEMPSYKECHEGEQEVTTCTGLPIDLAFAVDASGSVSQGDYERALDFVMQIVGGLNTIHNNTAQISLVQYGSGIHTVFTDEQDSFRIQNILDNVGKDDGGTNTAAAIDDLKSRVLTRMGSRKVMLVITDGASNDYTATVRAASQAKNSGIMMIAIGVGSANAHEINAIASSGKSHPHATYASLASLTKMLVDEICAEKKVTKKQLWNNKCRAGIIDNALKQADSIVQENSANCEAKRQAYLTIIAGYDKQINETRQQVAELKSIYSEKIMQQRQNDAQHHDFHLENQKNLNDQRSKILKSENDIYVEQLKEKRLEVTLRGRQIDLSVELVTVDGRLDVFTKTTETLEFVRTALEDIIKNFNIFRVALQDFDKQIKLRADRAESWKDEIDALESEYRPCLWVCFDFYIRN
jgi:uncharacterized protein YegL